MAGAINKTRLYTRIRPDWRAVKLLNKLRNKKDDFILRAIAQELESEGIQIEPSTMLLPTLLAPEGIFKAYDIRGIYGTEMDETTALAKELGME